MRVIVKKRPIKTVYLSQRNSSTDFPVLTCCVGLLQTGKHGQLWGPVPKEPDWFRMNEGILKILQQDLKAQEQAAVSFAQYAKEG